MCRFLALGSALLAALISSTLAQDYANALALSQLFYEAQRAGDLPDDNKVPWRKDSFLNDGQDNGIDLTGGWFDAGDHVKFGFPMAYSLTVLSMGMVDFAEGYSQAGESQNAMRTIKWATDYFMKAHSAPNELYGQVGNGGADHAYWGRPEDYNGERPSYKIDASHPGSDLAGETAAALAAASMVFRNGGDTAYADQLIQHAKELFDLANNNRGKYTDSIPDAAGYYESWSGYNDELVWAAAWLGRATADDSYLATAERLYNEFGFGNERPKEFSWDNKQAGVFALLYRLTGDSKYATKLEEFCNMLSSADKTPGGMLWLQEWGPARHAANAAFILLEADSMGLGGGNYRTMAKQQIDYLLGNNPINMSYQIGYGSSYPLRPHHRSSSCKTVEECGGCACNWSDFSSPDPNPQVLLGALVGGPDHNDQYNDSRQDFVHTEVATDYNAAFQGALAALV